MKTVHKMNSAIVKLLKDVKSINLINNVYLIWELFYILYSFFWSHMELLNWFLQSTIIFVILKTKRPPSCLTTRGTDTSVELGCYCIFIFLINEMVRSLLNIKILTRVPWFIRPKDKKILAKNVGFEPQSGRQSC